MEYRRMAIEKESPEELGYGNIRYNLAESSVSDQVFNNIQLNIRELSLCYTDHMGKPELRELLVAGETNLDKSHVLLTVGAAAALFIVASTLLTVNDHLIVIRPNYATNIETPKSIGCAITYIDLLFENNWQPDLDVIRAAVRSNTKYISITHPHNPTGTLIDGKILSDLVQLAETNNLYLLVDETYRELSFEEKLPLAAAMSHRAISVSSVSKAYGLPGLRIGWLITRDQSLMETFLAAKEQIFITNSVLDEEVACQFLMQRDHYFPAIRQHINTNFITLNDWLKREKKLECTRPGGGVVCFPRVKSTYLLTADSFYKELLEQHHTLVGPGHWFDMPDHYMRIGYGWPKPDELKQGLNNISIQLDKWCR